MISVSEAFDIVLAHSNRVLPKLVPLSQSNGRILIENISADTDLPPFDRITMDGIAVQFHDLENGIREFASIGIQRAGEKPRSFSGVGQCLEVMTGSVLPENADCIIPYEQCKQVEEKFRVAESDFKVFQNIHKKGSDKKQSDLVISAGTKISAAEIGVLASVGKNSVSVSSLPSVAIISTGDELVEVNETPQPWQLRRSNVYALESLLTSFQISPALFHIKDDADELRKELSHILSTYDVLVLSGGVSKGKFDLVPAIMEELGVQMLFHRVKQKPGKPFWFGKKENTVVFAFPGNPVSTIVCAVRYLLPWLRKSSGETPFEQPQAALENDFIKSNSLTHFLPVKLRWDKNELLAQPCPGHGSGDFSNLVLADAFLELPESNERCAAGIPYLCILFR